MEDIKQIANDWRSKGGFLKSSGTMGVPISHYQPVTKVSSNSEVAIAAQELTSESKILTVCNIRHAGGLLAQTLPAIFNNIEVEIKPFNADSFCNDIKGFTHTHLTPAHVNAIKYNDGCKNCNFTGLWVTCGSEPVHWDMIEFFVTRGAKFMANWGMTQVGPVAINALFDNIDKVSEYKRMCPEGHTILGDTSYCDYKIVEGELVVRGDISIYGNDWFFTKDRVTEVNGVLYYKDRM